MYEFLLRTVLGTFQYPLMHDLHLSPVRFALISSTAYQVIYGCMQIPVGMITHRFGLKRTLLFAVTFCAVANIGFSFVDGFYSALIFRVLMGFGSSFGFICLLIAVYDWMPRKNIALFIGISQFIGTMGPMVAAGPFNMLAQNAILTWREIFFSLGIIGFLLAVLVLFFVDKNRDSIGKFVILSRPSALSDSLRRLLSNKQVWLIAIYSSAVYFSIEYLSENEGVSFLIKKGFSPVLASYMITLAWLGYALSCPLLGFISDKIQRRKSVMWAAALSVFFSLIGIIYLPIGMALTAFCFIFLGLGASGQSIGFAIIAEQCKEDDLAVGLSVNNAMIMVFAAINAPLIGHILSKLVHGESSRLIDYRWAFSPMILFVCLGAFLSVLFIRETFCKSMRENTPLHPQ